MSRFWLSAKCLVSACIELVLYFDRKTPQPYSAVRPRIREQDVTMVESSHDTVALSWSGPSPYCEIGRNHPRDRHRMKPLEGHEFVWACARHSLFAQLVDKDAAQTIKRNDDFTMHDGSDGLVTGLGDERPGGTIVYYREK